MCLENYMESQEGWFFTPTCLSFFVMVMVVEEIVVFNWRPEDRNVFTIYQRKSWEIPFLFFLNSIVMDDLL